MDSRLTNTTMKTQNERYKFLLLWATLIISYKMP